MKTTLHLFAVGLRGIDEEVLDKKIAQASISFDVSGDTHKPALLEKKKVINGGTSCN